MIRYSHQSLLLIRRRRSHGNQLMHSDSGCFKFGKHRYLFNVHATIVYFNDWSQEIFIVHVPIDSSTRYLAFYTVRLYSQNSTIVPVVQAGMWVCTIFMMIFGMNPQPNTGPNTEGDPICIQCTTWHKVIISVYFYVSP